ncbi:alpha/beta hydrolase [Ensifer adhaerens]|uniref:alpha/beta hydrolase n=1 Tax=Ensifer adhaerens TaxID=106592 RepID=UPI001C4E2736|nr:alpha/beta-hydrolase family protein [Ensifer adhaerens]MBW0366457.1 alpha/beta-hydrolase family protein [Ensifer adhaerens]UCM18589.1 alpha/beta-hydrolase family protein [Ensifer adhaerens]
MDHLQQTPLSRLPMPRFLSTLLASFSTTGLIVGVFFFAMSLTPSLIPRPYVVQAVISGLSLSAGYAIGVLLRWLWSLLDLPEIRGRTGLTVKVLAALGCTAVALAFLWRTAYWQNTVRQIMGLDPVESAEPFKLGLIAALVFVAIVLIARLFRLTFRFLTRRFEHVLTRPLAKVAAVVAAVALFWSAVDGVIFRFALHAADSSFQRLDALIDPDVAPPTDPLKTGSNASLMTWDELGRQGRQFIASGPAAKDIGGFFGGEAKEPLRVYAGLNSAETAKERAKLALEELKRVGGFERTNLLIVVPTGTGWIDPPGLDSLEYLMKGDVASVAVQYSYLTSWLSLLVEPEYGAETADALFDAVYGYWTTLPKDRRPKLYLYGLSLGSMNSQGSVDPFDIISDPFQGALWVGSPFPTKTWLQITRNRNPGSPEWRPLYRDGSVIRFTNQENALNIPGATWGNVRIVYLQYASDPITFFDPYSFYREPDWMKAPRGADVSPALRWFPVVTMFQLLADMALATTSPIGYGHVYAPEHYIDAWMQVMAPADVSEADAERLKALLKGRY